MQSDAFCQSMQQTHSPSSISKVRSHIILTIPVASLVPFPLLNPNWSSPSTSSIFLSILLLSIFAIIFAVCEVRLIVPLSLLFVVCVFFFKALIVISVKSLGHCPVSYKNSYMVLISFLCIYTLNLWYLKNLKYVSIDLSYFIFHVILIKFHWIM